MTQSATGNKVFGNESRRDTWREADYPAPRTPAKPPPPRGESLATGVSVAVSDFVVKRSDTFVPPLASAKLAVRIMQRRHMEQVKPSDTLLTPDQSKAVGTALVVALFGGGLLFGWGTAQLAYLVACFWTASHFMQYSGWASNDAVSPRTGVMVLGTLVCLQAFVAFIHSEEERIDWKNVKSVCASRVAETQREQAICDDLQSALERRANLLASD